MRCPVLHRLERLGHIESSWHAPLGGRRRKYYRVTDQGRAELAEQRRQWATVVKALKDIWQTTGELPPVAALPLEA
jgi:DNA-binding PadR family transcriptional regulator